MALVAVNLSSVFGFEKLPLSPKRWEFLASGFGLGFGACFLAFGLLRSGKYNSSSFIA